MINREKLKGAAYDYIGKFGSSDPNFDVSQLQYEYQIFIDGAEWAEKELQTSKNENLQLELEKVQAEHSKQLRRWQGNALAHEEQVQILSEKLIELEAKHRWISVEERLPEQSKLVLVKFASNHFSLGKYVCGKFETQWDALMKTVNPNLKIKVTHWKEIE